MTFGEKLFLLRETENLTREQLAALLDCPQQTVCDWERDAALPDASQLVRLCDVFRRSPDELLRDIPSPGETSAEDSSFAETSAGEAAFPGASDAGETPAPAGDTFSRVTVRVRRSDSLRLPLPERTSRLKILDVPLWQIGRNARAIVAIGTNARGFVALGIRARGIIALGMFAMGVLSFGLMSLGLVSVGSLAAGLLAMGAVAFGPVAAGAVALGIVAVGAVAIGDFSVGAVALGRFIASGDTARAQVALGISEAIGSVRAFRGLPSPAANAWALQWLEENVPAHLGWAVSIMRMFL